MTKFVFKILGVILILLLSAFVLEQVVQSNYSIQTTEFEDWHKLDSINAETVVMGASRAFVMMDAGHLEKVTGRSTYVLANNGFDIFLLTQKFKHYLKTNSPPRNLVVTIDPFFLRKRNDLFDKKSFVKYIYHDEIGINKYLKEYEGFSILEEVLPMYRYRGEYKGLLRNIIGQGPKLKRVNGFERRYKQWDATYSKSQEPIDYILDEFYRLIELKDFCDSLKIKMIGVNMPMYQTFYDGISNENEIINLLDSMKIPYYDFNTGYNWTDTDLFYNKVHLNSIGVDTLNNIIVKETRFISDLK